MKKITKQEIIIELRKIYENHVLDNDYGNELVNNLVRYGENLNNDELPIFKSILIEYIENLDFRMWRPALACIVKSKFDDLCKRLFEILNLKKYELDDEVIFIESLFTLHCLIVQNYALSFLDRVPPAKNANALLILCSLCSVNQEEFLERSCRFLIEKIANRDNFDKVKKSLESLIYAMGKVNDDLLFQLIDRIKEMSPRVVPEIFIMIKEIYDDPIIYSVLPRSIVERQLPRIALAVP